MLKKSLILTILFVLLASSSFADAYSSFDWTEPTTSNPNYASIQIGTAGSNVLVEGATSTTALRIPLGAKMASIGIRGVTDYAFSGSITGASFTVGVFDSLTEANYFVTRASASVVPPPINDYFLVTGAVATLSPINTVITTYGRYNYPVAENQYLVIWCHGTSAAADIGTANNTGLLFTVRFQIE